MTDLILWRHAEAENAGENEDDLDRPLTQRGEKQAARMAVWLDRQLPDGLRVLASPARRTEQTAKALGRKYKLRAELLPGGQPDELLELAQWPRSRGAVLVVGHQPMLGQTVARLLGLRADECSIRKGAVWWLRHRQRQDASETILLAVQSPEFL
ncbi:MULTISPECIES: SixA phosphatase family protein [Diaphorobacter]|jgi:phosphohistidine phosphatase|uniref:Phosphohistidine phosphatase SixA n=1 Tax=Diaphorobacter nitroreducens TaxID=164759 RepID=A0AAX1WUM2_9BURK|nr:MULTISPECIES: histidine phosphatase family protein [Diaphorobacter]ABM42538.1 phosphohistidine phosphatase, SixA [Acidovorax sp. JS42]MDU7588063.1 histidine phosphatase family protein [Acidovorax sp.]TFI47621.1 histidine phosphatase family protein [Diaphorobacter sp. DS2]ASI68278.1 histidine phosphatase family protein [Diaphorobacter nitroreducens]MBV2216858.1 histidine phosphatase family protein [Diaphorobacter sp.]